MQWPPSSGSPGSSYHPNASERHLEKDGVQGNRDCGAGVRRPARTRLIAQCPRQKKKTFSKDPSRQVMEQAFWFWTAALESGFLSLSDLDRWADSEILRLAARPCGFWTCRKPT